MACKVITSFRWQWTKLITSSYKPSLFVMSLYKPTYLVFGFTDRGRLLCCYCHCHMASYIEVEGGVPVISLLDVYVRMHASYVFFLGKRRRPLARLVHGYVKLAICLGLDDINAYVNEGCVYVARSFSFHIMTCISKSMCCVHHRID